MIVNNGCGWALVKLYLWAPNLNFIYFFYQNILFPQFCFQSVKKANAITISQLYKTRARTWLEGHRLRPLGSSVSAAAAAVTKGMLERGQVRPEWLDSPA
jgi:hypothetical protein